MSSLTTIKLNQLSRQFRQFSPDRVHQRPNRLFGKIEANSGGFEQLGQQTSSAEFQGTAIVGPRLSAILLRLLPDLKPAKLGDSVFHVIKTRAEAVHVPMPARLRPRVVRVPL